MKTSQLKFVKVPRAVGGNLTNTYVHPAADGTTVEFWYDPRSRNWVVQNMDTDQCQIGTADYVYRREQAELAATDRFNEILDAQDTKGAVEAIAKMDMSKAVAKVMAARALDNLAPAMAKAGPVMDKLNPQPRKTFTNLRVTNGKNVWVVTGRMEAKGSIILTRIEGDITDKAGLKVAVKNALVDQS